MSSKGIKTYAGDKRGGKRCVTTATPNNSPIQYKKITRQLTAKEKKKAQRKLRTRSANNSRRSRLLSMISPKQLNLWQ